MSILKKIKQNLTYRKCKSQVIKSIDKNLIIDQSQYYILTNFLTRYEFLRLTWSNLSWVKTEKNQIAIFALVDHVFSCYYRADPFYWADNKKDMSEIEEKHWDSVTDLFEYPIDAYRNFTLNQFNKTQSREEFEKYKSHLESINFGNLLLNPDFNDLVYRYLLVYFYTDRFDEIDIYKDAIRIDDKFLKINKPALDNQIESVIITTPQLGLNFEFVHFRLLELKAFCDYTLRVSIDNNDFFSLKSNF